ncbi:conserved membrane hypothetical protein [Pseudomonas sp. 8AS]|uniref:O-unit flippase-like protein n=1 Tax=Pseudomonas sp. 8AS TaxID=2653163 RepID=UPI0012F0ED8F|nr:O-unit flippase-like protein [Pseudomonas sp. 8AS]VXB83206.1 conserved membrane hypothetical protein [Pseudomonas sp. 8AS]
MLGEILFSRRDISWGYAAQFLNIGAGLIMLPAVVSFMSTDEVGLWFVFVSIAGLAQLLELGFQPILIRNFSYVYAGAKELQAEELPACEGGKLDQTLFSDLLIASRRIYFFVSCLAAIFLLTAGTFYIHTLLPDGVNENYVLIGWGLYALGLVISFYYGYLNAVLQGRGQVSEANKVIVFSRVLFVILGVVLVGLGFGLVGMGVASIVSMVTSRFLALYFVFSSAHPEMKNLLPTKTGPKKIIFMLWHNASRFGVVLVGVFLIWRANVLIAASLLGLAEAASYGLAIQLFFILNTVASVPFNISMPKINTLRAQAKHGEVYKGVSMLLVLSLFIYLLGAVFIAVLGNYFLAIINSPTTLPASPILWLMVLVFLLEINHGSCANFIATGNKTPFAAAAIITGMAIVLSSLLLAPLLGMLGLVLAQGGMQVLYNNWKWPMETGKIFKVPYVKVLGDGFGYLVRSKL